MGVVVGVQSLGSRHCSNRLCTNLTSHEKMTDNEYVTYVVDNAAEVYGPCFPHVEKVLRCSYA